MYHRSAASQPAAPEGAILAQVEFRETPEVYAGLRYYWLDGRELQLTVAEPPRAGRAIELLWGSKKDRRTAVMVINGKTINLESGGYDGFRWLRVAIPEGVKGDRLNVTLRPGDAGKPAFLAAVRLIDPGAAQTPTRLRRPSPSGEPASP